MEADDADAKVWWRLPPDFAPIVRAHVGDAQAWLVATADPCHAVAVLEVERIQRHLLLVGYEALEDVQPGPLGYVAFLVCTPDEYDRCLGWLYDQPWITMRRTFLFVPRERDRDLIKAARHHGRVQVVSFHGFVEFHREFGLLFNWIIYHDAKRGRSGR